MPVTDQANCSRKNPLKFQMQLSQVSFRFTTNLLILLALYCLEKKLLKIKIWRLNKKEHPNFSSNLKLYKRL